MATAGDSFHQCLPRDAGWTPQVAPILRTVGSAHQETRTHSLRAHCGRWAFSGARTPQLLPIPQAPTPPFPSLMAPGPIRTARCCYSPWMSMVPHRTCARRLQVEAVPGDASSEPA